MLITDEWVDVDIDRKQLWYYLGYDADGNLPARISSLVDKYIETVSYLIKPTYSYVIKDVERVKGATTFLADSIIFESRDLAHLLEQCCKVAIFLATIGGDLEKAAHHSVEDGLILRGTVLDALGSAAVESVVDCVQGKITELANSQGFTTSPRFSPGHCDWALEQQKTIFQSLGENTAGVQLTSECLMIPQKSVSGIIGIGSVNNSIGAHASCNTCINRDCMERR